jgi:multidrug efflux pump subunit AcrB
VTDAAASVRDAILIGAVLAAGVLLLFLRNLKVTLIAVVVVPVVLAATVVLLWSLNMSFNIMTLGGMAAAVGLVIDDAIVMSEHIVRRLRGAPAQQHNTVMRAAIEFFRPLAGSSAATIVIFVPLAFLSGVTGAFFKALSLTMAAALVISFLVTWLAVPLVAGRLLSSKDAEQKEGGRVTDWMHARYERVMRRLLARPLWILLLIAPLCGLGWLAYHKVGSGFMPAMDEGGFIIDYRTQPGTALGETDRMLRQVEDILKETPEVQTYSRRTGTGLGGGLVEANEGDFFVRLKPPPRRPIFEVMAEVQAKIDERVRCVGRDGAVDGGHDRRYDGGAAADRDQAVFGRPTAVERAGAQDCRGHPQGARCHRCAQRHQAGGRHVGGPGGSRQGRPRRDGPQRGYAHAQQHRGGPGDDADAGGPQNGRRARLGVG